MSLFWFLIHGGSIIQLIFFRYFSLTWAITLFLASAIISFAFLQFQRPGMFLIASAWFSFMSALFISFFAIGPSVWCLRPLYLFFFFIGKIWILQVSILALSVVYYILAFFFATESPEFENRSNLQLRVILVAQIIFSVFCLLFLKLL
jgi:hypothetical protein